MGGSTTDPFAFRPLPRRAAPVHAIDRSAARAGYRIFHGADGFEVAVPEHVIDRMITIGRGAAPLEWYGVVVGRVCEDGLGRHVVIVGIVLDPDARAERHTVHSTVESESRLRERARTFFPDAAIVGWVHGHVRHGAQYSEPDRRNQRSWREAHAIGIVCDPWDPCEIAVYRGPESEQLSLSEDHSPVDREEPLPQPVGDRFDEEHSTPCRPATAASREPSRVADRVAILVAILLAIWSLFHGYGANRSASGSARVIVFEQTGQGFPDQSARVATQPDAACDRDAASADTRSIGDAGTETIDAIGATRHDARPSSHSSATGTNSSARAIPRPR